MSNLYPSQRSNSLSLALVLLCCSRSLFIQAKTVSRIIDDSFGDEVTGYRPVYYPLDSTVWRSNCGTSQGCSTVPDANFVQNRTWTAATYKANMTDMGFGLQFKGTAISVYFINTNQLDSTANTKDTQCNFTLDGSDREQYEHKAVSGQSFEYNVSVFTRTGLENKWHTLQVNTGKLDHDTYISFDYARYTTEVSDDDGNGNANSTDTDHKQIANTKKTSNVGAIVGGVIGGLALLSVVILTSLFILRRKSSSSHRQIPEPQNQVEATWGQPVYSLPTREHLEETSALRERIQQLQEQLDSFQIQSSMASQSPVQSYEPPPPIYPKRREA